MPQAQLTDRAVLAVTGPGATAFLQGLVTNDVTKVNPGSSAYAALLTPQGKIVTDFLIHAAPDGYRLDVAAAHAPDLLKRLKLYRLRAPVGLDDVSAAEAVFAAWGEAAPAAAAKDPRLDALGGRWIAAPDTLTADAGLAGYHAHRLALGVPDSADTAGQFALDANLEELHGVDFRKGCYVGQEVTARMKHKAAPRRRLIAVIADGDLPSPGSRLTTPDGADAGEVATGSGHTAIASLRLGQTETHAEVVSLKGARLKIAAPPYLNGTLAAARAKN